ncbi:MAG TPA: glycosyltransferase family 9 protein [Mycobacteriales bacterium]|nr:glycosyltransferase family 9 protein [Mycobacteriales bacterium]
MTRRLGTVLVARLDNDGDVLLAGPVIRAAAAHARRVVLLAGPRGQQAAALLPGVAEVLCWPCPWIDPDPPPVDPTDVEWLVKEIAARPVERALVLTSYHQSPLPLALVLRLAGVPWVGAISDDYPGSLLDLRHRPPETGLHEVERMLSLATAAGLPLPPGDDGRLAVRRPLPDTRALTGADPYVVVHPGASVPARVPTPGRMAEFTAALVDDGCRVVVTGAAGEASLTAEVAAPGGVDLGGRLTFTELGDVLDRAAAVVVGNTGPAHLAAAVGTPVVSLFAPVVPAERWRPWRVPTVLLGDQEAPCAASRARACPVPGHPCLDTVAAADVVAAVETLAPHGRPPRR